MLELAVEKFDNYLNDTIEIFVIIKNDNKLTASIFKYFYEVTLNLTYLSEEFSNDVLTRIFENMKRIKIYKIDEEINQLVKSLNVVTQKLSTNSISNKISERRDIVEDYLNFLSQVIDSREEEIVNGEGYFSGFSRGQVVSFLTHEKMSFPTQVAGEFSLTNDISFGDKVSAKIKYIEDGKSYLESMELIEKIDLSEPRILEISSQPDDKFVIRDFKTNWFISYPTKEMLQKYLQTNLEALAASTKGSIYIEGVLESVGKRIPVPKFESFKEIYSVDEKNHFNYLIKLKHLYSTVEDVKEDLTQIKEKIQKLKLINR